MRKQWCAHWCNPESNETKAEAWAKKAAEAGMQREQQRQWKPPAFEAFAKAIRKASGAAGFDGWDSKELNELLEYTPWLVQELHEVLVQVTWWMADNPDKREAVQNLLQSWSVVARIRRLPPDKCRQCSHAGLARDAVLRDARARYPAVR